MKLTATPLPGAFVLDIEPQRDERGMFARTFCRDELAAHGLVTDVAQCSVSVTERRGTLRGMHYQAAPHHEAKLVRCVRGEIHDVLVDLRPASPTYLRSFAIVLSAASHRALYIPADVAHGFLTLVDDVEVLYQISTPYRADAARGVRWDDPALAIAWPFSPNMVSARDASFPLLEVSR